MVGAGQAGDHRVGVAVRHHAGGEHVAALVHQALAVAEQQPDALLAPIEELGVGPVVLGQPGIVDLDAVEAADAHALQRLRDAVLAADQDRRAQPLIAPGDRGADALLLLAFREHDALGCAWTRSMISCIRLAVGSRRLFSSWR